MFIWLHEYFNALLLIFSYVEFTTNSGNVLLNIIKVNISFLNIFPKMFMTSDSGKWNRTIWIAVFTCNQKFSIFLYSERNLTKRESSTIR